MIAEHEQLYQRLQAYQLDDPNAQYAFMARLAAENGWSTAYAERVVDEYKKFVFLAVIAGHPVTPSDAVDQAWHLHMTYTRAYWEEFCPDVLGMRLHHSPTSGGTDEKTKFTEWYTQTLESYRNVFGENPPTDIWPPAYARFAGTETPRRVDTGRNWIVPKIWVELPFLIFVVFVVNLGIAYGIRSLERGVKRVWNRSEPLDSVDVQALWAFGIGIAVATAIAMLLRSWLRGPGGSPLPDTPELDAYEAAYLAGGKGTVLHAAVASLISRHVLKVDKAGTKLERGSTGSASPELHAVEQAVLDAVPAAGSSFGELEQKCRFPEHLADRLHAFNLILSPGVAKAGEVLPRMVVLGVPLLGVCYMLGSLIWGPPTGVLIIPCIVAFFGACVAFETPLHRSRRGDSALTQLKTQHAELNVPITADAARSGIDVARAVGLFGIGLLAGGIWMSAHTLLKPRPQAHGFDAGVDVDSGCGSGCGGGGCGCG